MGVLRRSKPDLVVLDVMLPSGSGYDICRRLRDEHGDVPVLFLTAAPPKKTEWPASRSAATITSSSRSPCASFWPGSARCCAAARSAPMPPPE